MKVGKGHYIGTRRQFVEVHPPGSRTLGMVVDIPEAITGNTENTRTQHNKGTAEEELTDTRRLLTEAAKQMRAMTA
ncbi:hypothetical protein E2C01_060541 [Portunus trituberculatus]|uniref:Uncharacterized protein n=1 Tax=Portunus trituberculatus TaxID=210409 RepID=A0A5B7HCD6_PORTR|nr:hypothetical protein [Portunus trituberculatus]